MDKTTKLQYIRELKKMRLELSENRFDYKKFNDILNKYNLVLPKILNYSDDQETKTKETEVKSTIIE